MTAKDLKLDYFKFYDVPNQPVGDWVTIEGQFDEGPERVRILYLDRFGNAVSKNREPFFDRNSHLTWYAIFDPAPEPTRRVMIENQFGQQRLIIGPARALLAPARKYVRGSVFPARLDHFKVYRVLDGAPVDRPVVLQDQFGRDKVHVTVPVGLAVPVTKEHAGIRTPVKNKRAHLVIYRVTPRPVSKNALIRDQFGRRVIATLRSNFLAAPSAKLDWKVM
jgi:hypothetical protein